MTENSENCYIEPAFMRVKKVAEYLGIHVSSVWRLVRAGKLEAPIRMGTRCTLFTTKSVKAFAEKFEAESRKEREA